jgi:hypothetical protein
MAVTSASFTLMDYTDGISLITGIDSNLPLVSQYDQTNKILSPSWAGDTSLQLTPKVIKAGTSTDLVENMTDKIWYRKLGGATEWTKVVSGSNGETINTTTGVLTVSEDKLVDSNNQIEYKFTGNYLDSLLLLTFPVEIVVSFARVINGTSTVVARAYAVNGNQFKNGEPTSLTIKAELIRGASADTTNLTYSWQKSINGTTWTTFTGTTSTISVEPKDVDSFAMFRCTIKDTDATSETYNKSFTTDAVSILDVSDPIQAVVLSTAGSYFKNETGSTILYCKIYQNGSEIDATGEKYTYTWTKTDKDGNAVSFTPEATTYGQIVATKKKAITVSHTDVDVKSTFFCEVSE